MKKALKLLSLLLAVTLVMGMLGITATAAGNTYSLAALLESGKLKPLGRTQAKSDKSGILTDWSGSGFEINVFASADTTVSVSYTSNYVSYWAMLVDGKEVWRGQANSGTGSFSAPVPYGTHTVSVVKETQLTNKEDQNYVLNTVTTDAAILAAPKAKDLYIEFIGDSYSCGDGALAEYVPGVQWSTVDDSATHGFPWYTAQALNADYSIVARGGIGLFDGTSAQEGTKQNKTMTDVYPYVSGFKTGNGEYAFATNQPDIIVVELGANDGIDSNNPVKTIGNWEAKMTAFLTLVRQKNPTVPIVCINHEVNKYAVLKRLVESGDFGEAYAFFYAFNGNGSAAVDWQREGHPSWQDHQDLAKNLVNFLRYNGLVEQPVQTPEATYTDVTYYVSESGSDSNTGLAPETAMLTVNKAIKQAYDNRATYTDNHRVVIRVSGTVVGANSQILGNSNVIKAPSGKYIPILITTHNYDSQADNKAVLKIVSNPAAEGAAAMYTHNDLYLQNVEIRAITSTTPDSKGNYHAPFNFYASGQNVTFDNVKFTNDGKATTVKKWEIGAVNFSTGNSVQNAVTTERHGSITFKNGDYTGLNVVAAVKSSSIWRSTENGGSITSLPKYHAKLVIGEGAVMNKVFGLYGVMAVGSCTVEVNGGTVAEVQGTSWNTFASPIFININGGTIGKVHSTRENGNVTGNVTTVVTGGHITELRGNGGINTINGNVTTTISGGVIDSFVGSGGTATIKGNVTNNITGGLIKRYAGVSTSVTVNGDLTNNISGGKIEVRCSEWKHSICLGGLDKVTIKGNLNNNISGGELHIYNDGASANIYFGGLDAVKIAGNINNHVTGGSFAAFNGTGSGASFTFGNCGGNTGGTLTNRIEAGSFVMQAGSFFVDGQAAACATKKIVNIFGREDKPNVGPRFNRTIFMAGNWGQVGATAYDSTGANRLTAPSDTVVVSNTIYGGTFGGAVYGGNSAAASQAYNFPTYICGSIENNIYGGNFLNHFFGGAKSTDVYGKVTNNIYGGRFSSIFGGGETCTIHDGVETNVYGLTDMRTADLKAVAANRTPVFATYYFHAGNSASGTVKATTSGRAASKLVFTPENPEDITLYRNIHNGSGITGTAAVEIAGGVFPQNFTLGQIAVKDALAEGSYCLVNDAVVTPADDATSVSGAVTVKPVAAIVGTTPYESLNDALKAGSTVKLGSNTEVDLLHLNPGAKLDLNGKKLIADNVLCFGDFTDSTDGEGGVYMSSDPSKAVLHLQANNSQLPIYDNENGCYRFFNYSHESVGSKNLGNGVTKFGFRLLLNNPDAYALLRDAASTGVSIQVNVSVRGIKIPYTYSSALVKNYVDNALAQLTEGEVKTVFTLTVAGMSSLRPSEVLTVTPSVSTPTNMQFDLAVISWTAE